MVVFCLPFRPKEVQSRRTAGLGTKEYVSSELEGFEYHPGGSVDIFFLPSYSLENYLPFNRLVVPPLHRLTTFQLPHKNSSRLTYIQWLFDSLHGNIHYPIYNIQCRFQNTIHLISQHQYNVFFSHFSIFIPLCGIHFSLLFSHFSFLNSHLFPRHSLRGSLLTSKLYSIFCDLSSQYKKFIFSSKFNSLLGIVKPFNSDILFCSQRSLDYFNLLIWMWSITTQPNIPSQSICSTDYITHIVSAA